MERRLLVLVSVLVASAVPQASARTMALPSDITAEATGPSGAVVDYDSGDLTCTPPSGSTFPSPQPSTFPFPQTTVTCTHPDGSPAGSFNVNVVDTKPPEVSVPKPITAEATGPQGATVSFSATAADLVDPAPAVSCARSGNDSVRPRCRAVSTMAPAML